MDASSSEETCIRPMSPSGVGLMNPEGVFTCRARGDGGTDAQDGLLVASVEARLAEEMRGLILALTQFSRRAQLISEDLPQSAQFCKLVSGSFVLMALQLAIAIGKSLDKPIFLDDGREYLRNLGLGLNEFFREIDLDGRRFLAIALIEQSAGEVSGRAKAGEK